MGNVTIQNGNIRQSASNTPSDATFIDAKLRGGLYITTGGSVAVEYENGVQDTFTVGDLTTMHVRVQKVLSTGTTASGIKNLGFEL